MREKERKTREANEQHDAKRRAQSTARQQARHRTSKQVRIQGYLQMRRAVGATYDPSTSVISNHTSTHSDQFRHRQGPCLSENCCSSHLLPSPAQRHAGATSRRDRLSSRTGTTGKPTEGR
jgi:hypothetical protein